VNSIRLFAAHQNCARLVTAPLKAAGINVTEVAPVTLVIDVPQLFAFRVLESLSTTERSRCVVLAQSGHPDYLACLADYFPSGIVSVFDDAQLLISALHTAAAGRGTVFHESDLRRAECRVVRDALLGFSTEEIAARTGTAVKTVNAHVSNVLRRAGFGSRAEYLMALIGCGAVPRVERRAA
jgi:DNA-binding NarL/FixJ family response regulator